MTSALENVPTFTDVTLAPVDDQTVSAHSVILASPSALSKNMNYTTNPTNLLKNMKKNAERDPMKIIFNSKSTGYKFSSGTFSEVILPALQAMTPGFTDSRGGIIVEVTSSTIRTDLINIADSSLIRIKVSNSAGLTGEATVHLYLHNHSMLVQGSTSLDGIPVWKVCSDWYLFYSIY